MHPVGDAPPECVRRHLSGQHGGLAHREEHAGVPAQCFHHALFQPLAGLRGIPRERLLPK
jgi:hypothetical protein